MTDNDLKKYVYQKPISSGLTVYFNSTFTLKG